MLNIIIIFIWIYVALCGLRNLCMHFWKYLTSNPTTLSCLRSPQVRTRPINRMRLSLQPTTKTKTLSMVFDKPTPPACPSSILPLLHPYHRFPLSSSGTQQIESERCTDAHYLSCASSPWSPQYLWSDREGGGWRWGGETLADPSGCLSQKKREEGASKYCWDFMYELNYGK